MWPALGADRRRNLLFMLGKTVPSVLKWFFSNATKRVEGNLLGRENLTTMIELILKC